MGTSFGGPWACMGDFNALLYQADKQGGNLVASSSSGGFRSFLLNIGMVDVGFVGNPFTWTNGRFRRNFIQERLDRVMANGGWCTSFPRAILQHFPRTTFNHAMLLLDTVGEQNSGPRQFKFELFWTRDSFSFDVVKKAWVFVGSRSHAFVMTQCLKNTRVALRDWNRGQFGCIQTNIIKLQCELDCLQHHPHLSVLLDKEQDLKARLGEELKREEQLWRQKSRVTWLTTSDLNTKFFHLFMIICRMRDNIDALSDSEGNWLEGRKAIGNHMRDHFKSLFAWHNPQFPRDLNGVVPRLVESEDNLALCCCPSVEEI